MQAGTRKREESDKSPELIEAEKVGKKKFNTYCRAKQGNIAQLSKDTGLAQGTISTMSTGPTAISLESAIKIEVATRGELRADELCPSRAEWIAQFLALRANKAE